MLLVCTGETLDYLTFEVTARTSVRLIGLDLSSDVFLAMGQVVGGGEPFDVAGFPYRVFEGNFQSPPSE